MLFRSWVVWLSEVLMLAALVLRTLCMLCQKHAQAVLCPTHELASGGAGVGGLRCTKGRHMASLTSRGGLPPGAS